MAQPLVSDELWSVTEPLLPQREAHVEGGRPLVVDRKALTGIVFVSKSGIPWEMLRQEMGCGSAMTCWRRLLDWQSAGVWDRLNEEFLKRQHGADQIDLSRGTVDVSSVHAAGGKNRPKPNRSAKTGV